MKRIITYGTFDMLHTGHINILKRAKELGDYLIVGVTSEKYDLDRGKLNIQQSLSDRIENVKQTGLADKIIVEETLGQKIEDIQKYKIDTFVIGSDWSGKFDYLNEYCEVIYLPRTQGISSTELRNQKRGILKIGLIGHGRIARRFMTESKYVAGHEIISVLGIEENELKNFATEFEIKNTYTNVDEFLKTVDAVYIATPHLTHQYYAKKALLSKKHVLCEKPLALNKSDAEELVSLANENKLILFEAIKTAYAPGFQQLINIAKSGAIGEIKNVTATFTKLVSDKSLREFNPEMGGGAFNELATYPLLGIIKILGTKFKNISFKTFKDKSTNIDLFSKADILYPKALASLTVGIGVKQEGDMVISGTKGYIYVPAPWWKTEYFEVRFENPNHNQKYYVKFDGDGLRYELAEFLNSIHQHNKTYKLSNNESIVIASIFEKFHNDVKNKQADIIQ